MSAKPQWATAHRAARFNPLPGFERAIVCAIDALQWYAEAHAKRWGSKLGEDYVLGEAWESALRGVLALLNGETGRLDCGLLDRELRAMYLEAGFEGEL